MTLISSCATDPPTLRAELSLPRAGPLPMFMHRSDQHDIQETEEHRLLLSGRWLLGNSRKERTWLMIQCFIGSQQSCSFHNACFSPGHEEIL